MSEIAWTVRHDDQLNCYSVENDEELIADLFYAHDIPDDQERQRVKAHMISAAPALLEALAILLNWADETAQEDVPNYKHDPKCDCCPPRTAARAALALARGETP